MGENIKAIVGKKFKHHSNAAFQRRLMTPELFSATPFLCYHNYRCRTTNGNVLTVGDEVVVVRAKHSVMVWLEAHPIGEIEGDDAVELIEALEAEPRAGKCLMARIEEEVGIDGRFSIMLTEGVQRVITPTIAE